LDAKLTPKFGVEGWGEMQEPAEKLLHKIAVRVITASDLSRIELGEEIGVLRWTGWKESYAILEKHAQLVLFTPKENPHHYYVDLPSMKHGRFHEGECFSIEYVDGVSKPMYPGEVTLPMVREWFKEALMLLLADVVMDRPELIEQPYPKKN
jgi:hypothetical protein